MFIFISVIVMFEALTEAVAAAAAASLSEVTMLWMTPVPLVELLAPPCLILANLNNFGF